MTGSTGSGHDGAGLGRQASLLLRDELVVGRRLGTGLALVARAHDAAVLPVLDALQVLIATGLTGRTDAGPFVELAADLGERTARRVALSPELATLAAGRSSSALARAARRLL